MRAFIVFALFALAGVGLSAFGDHHRKAITPQAAGYQTDIYLFGGTYRSLVANGADQCASFCGDDRRCRAWSFVPAKADDASVCELKRSGGLPEAQPQAVSGRSPAHEAQYGDLPRGALRDAPGRATVPDATGLAGGPGSS